MSEEQAFLDAIIEVSGDDTARLVYADWLDGNGRPERAGFIRLQVEAARLPEGGARVALEVRAQRLLDEHGPNWLAGTGLSPAVVRFRRGFPDELDFWTVDWEEEPEDGWDAVPEEGLLASLLTALRSWPELGCVRSMLLCSEEGMGPRSCACWPTPRSTGG